MCVVVVVSITIMAVIYVEDKIPSCEDHTLIKNISRRVGQDHHLNGIFIVGIETVDGALFGPRTCRALATEIRGNVDLTKRMWMKLQYGSPETKPIYTIMGSDFPPIVPGPNN